MPCAATAPASLDLKEVIKALHAAQLLSPLGPGPGSLFYFHQNACAVRGARCMVRGAQCGVWAI